MLPAVTLAVLLVSQGGYPEPNSAPAAFPPQARVPAPPQYPSNYPADNPQPFLPSGFAQASAQPPGQYFPGPAMPPGPVAPAAAPQDAGPAYVTQDQLQAALKTLSFSKGDIRVVPYGTFWGNMAYDSQHDHIGDYSLWIDSPSVARQSDFAVDAKSSRFGIDVFGPPLPLCGGMQVDGKVEIDFQGQFMVRDKPSVLLRHAYVEAKNDQWRILIGQTWDVISPLNMPTIDYANGWTAGNIGYRRAQFRVERYLDVSDTSLITLQDSLNVSAVTDFDESTTIVGSPGPYPDVQGRAAWTAGQRTGPDAHPWTFGVAGHIGEQDFDFLNNPNPNLPVYVKTWSLDADASMPFGDCWGVEGEFFTGYNLSAYLGGILQGVDPVTERGIHATGGWFDIFFNFRPDLHNHNGYGIDHPLVSDMTTGRTRNQVLFTNLIYDLTNNLQTGFEVDLWQTDYIALQSGRAVRLLFATKYFF